MTLPRHWFLLSCLLCALLACLPFLDGLHGGFVFDDGPNIVDNPGVHMATLDTNAVFQVLFGPQPGGITRILPTLSFAVDHWRGGGLDPVIFKATNIGIHALTAMVLAGFLLTLLQATAVPQKRASLCALGLSLAWAIHPLQVSSVLYVVQRMQTLCTLFVLLGLWAYLKARMAQIEGRSGRTGLLLVVLLWGLAMASKEDAILLPIYLLALELTVLHFRAATPDVARTLRRGYLLMAAVGATAFLLVVVPHYWHWDAYPGRDFTTWERLLTQGRVLSMYLGQILMPLPRYMPFYYDWVQPSRGLLQPWTTLPALLLLAGLAAAAWRLRTRRPLFALGVSLFFAGHFVTSNVVGLELAFEHRNHFPLIGALLAIGDLCAWALQYMRLRPALGIGSCAALLLLLGGTAAARARIWDSPLTLARASTEFAPQSARAWNSLCLYYYDLGGGNTPNNPYLDKAIDICGQGAANAPDSVTGLTNLVVFKTRRGSITSADWNALQQRLQRVTLGPENMRTVSVLMSNVATGTPLDESNVIKSLDIISQRTTLGLNELAAIGYFILTETGQPDRAYPYFARAVQAASPGTAFTGSLVSDLKERGRTDWARKLEALAPSQSRPKN